MADIVDIYGTKMESSDRRIAIDAMLRNRNLPGIVPPPEWDVHTTKPINNSVSPASRSIDRFAF